MDVFDVIQNFAISHNYNEYAFRRLMKDYSDFSGIVVRTVPEGYKEIYKDLVVQNEGRAPKLYTMPVGAVLTVKRSSKIIRRFWCKNRVPTVSEKILIRLFYPPHVTMVHAEFDCLLKFMEWYNWKEPRKRKRYRIELFVVRYNGRVPSRPCVYCRNAIKRVLAGHDVTVMYPLDGKYFAMERLL